MLYPAPTSGGVIDILGLQSVDDIVHTDFESLKSATDVSRWCNQDEQV